MMPSSGGEIRAHPDRERMEINEENRRRKKNYSSSDKSNIDGFNINFCKFQNPRPLAIERNVWRFCGDCGFLDKQSAILFSEDGM
jgi:hypothetical protein